MQVEALSRLAGPREVKRRSITVSLLIAPVSGSHACSVITCDWRDVGLSGARRATGDREIGAGQEVAQSVASSTREGKARALCACTESAKADSRCPRHAGSRGRGSHACARPHGFAFAPPASPARRRLSPLPAERPSPSRVQQYSPLPTLSLAHHGELSRVPSPAHCASIHPGIPPPPALPGLPDSPLPCSPHQMSPLDPPAMLRNADVAMSTRPEDLGTRMSRASPSRPDARPAPRWLLQIMQERAGLHENAQERGAPGDSAHASGARVEGSGQSRDPQNYVDKVAGERVDGQRPHEGPAAAVEDAAPLPPAPLPVCDDVPPATTGPSSCGAELEPFASSSRHSYGDFSSASSTASSSTSHSGFSSASASSFTSASSTQTFSAAGWTAGTQAACAPHALPSLAEVAVKAYGDEAGDVDTTPVAEAPGAPVSAIDFEPTVPFALTSAARLPLPSTTVSVSPAAPRPLSHVPRAPPAHFDPPSRPTSSQSGSDPASSGTLVNAHAAHQPPPSPSLTSTSGGGFAAPLPSDDGQCHAGSAILKHSNEGIDWDDGTLRPPENFAMVSPRLYRSSFPRKHNFPFLRSLGLKSVMCVYDLLFLARNSAY